MNNTRRLVWFSCGAASAVLAKLAVTEYGEACEVIYCDTLSAEHPDNARFLVDVEQWIGRSIRIIKSAIYSSVDDVFERRRYMAGLAGAICTTQMKKVPREVMQQIDDIHLFGYTTEETKRADNFEDRNPALRVEWLLIEKGITKSQCLDMLKEASIPLPAMYGLGYSHNNCLGCVKSTSAGYWNQIRRDFPEVFARRARQSRDIGARLVRIRLPSDPPSKAPLRHFLDELPSDADAPHDDIECGPVCQAPSR